MYTDKITQSVAEAVKKVMAEELSAKQKSIAKIAGKKSEIDSADLAALRSGAKPVKEGWQDMLDDVKKRAGPQPNGGAGMKQGSRYGGSKQKDEPEDKKEVKEDIEKIEELSKTTLGSYIKKATNDKADRAYGNGWWDSRGGRTTYPPKDTPIENKTEVDQKQRNAGIKRAVNKLTREDIEQIDELSKTTLGSYIKKAADDKSKTAYDHGYIDYANDGDKPERVSMYDKVELGQKRRNAGIKRAVNKLTREEQDINAINGVKMSSVDESSHQAKTTMKHIPNASPELKKAAKDIKPGIAGFRDRIAMLKAGGVKE